MSQEGHPPTPEKPNQPGRRYALAMGVVSALLLGVVVVNDVDAADEDRVWIETT